MIDLNTGIKHLAFDVSQQHIWAIHLNMYNNEVSYVTKEFMLHSSHKWQQDAR
jgi:hypothetical protein